MKENFLYLSTMGPNKGKWIVVTEKACLNLAEQGYQVRKVVVDEVLSVIDIDADDPWGITPYA
jgi:hypothetical protein